jgi:hypothetical protein
MVMRLDIPIMVMPVNCGDQVLTGRLVMTMMARLVDHDRRGDDGREHQSQQKSG